MHFVGLIATRTLGGFFYDDQAAIAAGAAQDGEAYQGAPLTRGFPAVRFPAAALGIGLRLDDGTVAWGDAMSVQYAGAAGRDDVFDPSRQHAVLLEVVGPRLEELTVSEFRGSADWVAALRVNGRPLHAGLQYGLTQALLRAAAVARRCTMAQVLTAEFGLPLVARGVPVHCQSGDERHRNTERMILKRADSLPHGLINSPQAFGDQGARFLELVAWVAGRVRALADSSYRPTLHFDVYGSIGRAFDNRTDAVADFLEIAERAASPFRLRIESPVDLGSRAAQIDGCAALVSALSSRGSNAQVVVDEWCNTLEDIEAFARARRT